MEEKRSKENGHTVEAAYDVSEAAQFAAVRGQAATDKYGRPLVKIDPKAEARLRKKIDLFVVPTVFVLYLLCSLDRAHIGNARIAGLDKDLGLAGNDYNVILTVFFIPYILLEIPMNAACKRIGPGWFLPAITLGFGTASLCTAFVQNRAQACGVRVLVGIFESGMMPGIAYYLSRWYRRSELAFRLALYVVAMPLSGAFGGLLASGILTLQHFGGLHTWRMIFAIEGLITMLIAIMAFFTLTDRPETARWLTAEERALAIARVKSERLGATEVLDGFSRTKMARGIVNPVTLSTAAMFLLDSVTAFGLAFFAPTIIQSIYPHASVVTQQLYTVPPYVVGAVVCLAGSLLSWRTDRRALFLVLCAPLMMLGCILALASRAPHVRYAAIFLIASSTYLPGVMTNAQVSANVVSDTARNAAIGFNVMGNAVGGLISTWTFLPRDAPGYPIGNGLNLATTSLFLVVAAGSLVWMKQDNKRRERRNVESELAGLTPRQIQDLEWKHPAFRWRP